MCYFLPFLSDYWNIRARLKCLEEGIIRVDVLMSLLYTFTFHFHLVYSKVCYFLNLNHMNVTEKHADDFSSVPQNILKKIEHDVRYFNSLLIHFLPSIRIFFNLFFFHLRGSSPNFSTSDALVYLFQNSFSNESHYFGK